MYKLPEPIATGESDDLRDSAALIARERDLPRGVGALQARWRDLPATLPLWPETGQLLGLSRAATFRAAARGDFQVVTLGRRRLALTVPLLKLLGLELVDRP
jgi:hypothetical protein